MSDEQDWKPIRIVGGDGEEAARGRIEMATGIEERPCAMCRHWENVGAKRVIEHFLSRGLTLLPDGRFETPIAKDFPGRKSLKLDPTQFGFCRVDLMPTDQLSTCEAWSPTRTKAEFQDRMRRR